MQLRAQAGGSRGGEGGDLRRADGARVRPGPPRIAGAGALVLGLALGWSGCSPPAPDAGAADVRVTLELAPRPPVEGPARAELRVADAAGAPLPGARVRLEANMNHAGMVPELALAADQGDGRYVADFEFTMGGDWYVLAELSLPDGRELSRTFPVPGVAAR